MINRMAKENNTTIFGGFVCLVVALTTLSQMPMFVESSVTRIISNPIWIILLVACLLVDPRLFIDKVKVFFILTVMLLLYQVIAMFSSSSGYLSWTIPKVILLSCFVLLVGTCVGRIIRIGDIEHIFNVYILCSLVVCASIYMSYIRGQSLVGRTYLYSSKNSVSQMLLYSWILIVFLKIRSDISLWRRLFYMGALVLLTWTLIGLKSRASLVGIPIVAIVILLNGNYNRKLRNFMLIAIIAVIVFFITNQSVFNSFIDNIILGGREITNLNDISSGRADEFTYFFRDFSENGFFGDSFDKRESVFLSSFLQHGMIGGVLISLMVLYPFRWVRRNSMECGNYYLIMKSIAIVSIINGAFEQQAPFGPGAKCFLLWFLLGIFSTIETYEQETEYDNYG